MYDTAFGSGPDTAGIRLWNNPKLLNLEMSPASYNTELAGVQDGFLDQAQRKHHSKWIRMSCDENIYIFAGPVISPA